MALVLARFIFCSLLFFGLGHGLTRWLLPGRRSHSLFWLSLLNGMILYTALAQLYSLFAGFGWGALAITLLLGLVPYVFYYKKGWLGLTFGWQGRQDVVWLAIFSLVGLAALMKAAAFTTAFDHGLYYIQFMRWTEEFGVVKGLANVHDRFGFNSSFHVFTAWFNWARYGLPGAYDEWNEYLFLLVFFQAVAWYKEGKAKGFWAIFMLFYLLYALLFFLHLLSHPTADSAIGFVLAYWVGLLMWFRLEEKGEQQYIISIMAQSGWILAFLVTVKPSALVYYLFLPVALLAWLAIGNAWRGLPLKSLVFSGLLLIGPYLLRGHLLSGYPLFPVHWVKTADEWAYPVARTKQTAKAVTLSARFTSNGIVDGKFVVDMHDPWVAQWWQKERLVNKLIYLGALFWMGFLLYRAFALRKSNTLWAGWLLAFVLTMLGALLVWIAKAPAMRLGLGTFFLLWVMGMCELWQLRRLRIPLSSVWVLGLSLVLAYTFRDKYALTRFHLFPGEWFVPKTKIVDEATGTCAPAEIIQNDDGSIGGKIHQCWDAPLPCVQGGKQFELLGDDLNSGFKNAE